MVARGASAGGITVQSKPARLDGDVDLLPRPPRPGPPTEPGPDASWRLTIIGTVAATLTAAAIRDAVRQAART